jgi:hypothetical protein
MIAIGFVLLAIAFIAHSVTEDPPFCVRAVIAYFVLIGLSLLISGAAKWLWMVVP